MKVAVVFPYYAHYRESIVDILLSDKEVDYYFFGDNKVAPQFKGMRLMDWADHPKFINIRSLWFFKYFSIQPALIKKLKENNFDCVIVFADWKYLSTWRLASYLKRNSIPVLFWSHGFRDNRKSLNAFLKKRYFNLFDGGLVFDHRAKEIFKKKGFKSKIEVIYNSLDYEKQRRVREKVEIDNENKISFIQQKPYIVFSGRLTHTKNLSLIFEAISILKKRGIIVNGILIGEGEYKQDLISLSDKLGIEDQITFFGSCYNEEILSRCFLDAIACVIPSAVGLSAIHSLTYGCPVITDNNNVRHGPEVEAVADKKTGRIYEAGNSNDLASKIEFFRNMTESEKEMYKFRSMEMIEKNYTAKNQQTILRRQIRNFVNNNPSDE